MDIWMFIRSIYLCATSTGAQVVVLWRGNELLLLAFFLLAGSACELDEHPEPDAVIYGVWCMVYRMVVPYVVCGKVGWHWYGVWYGTGTKPLSAKLAVVQYQCHTIHHTPYTLRGRIIMLHCT